MAQDFLNLLRLCDSFARKLLFFHQKFDYQIDDHKLQSSEVELFSQTSSQVLFINTYTWQGDEGVP